MVAIAIPASCIGAQTCADLEQATYVLYEISRACALFNVSEIVIYSHPAETDAAAEAPGPKKIKLDDEAEQPRPAAKTDEELVFSANMLQYLITPVYLRKLLFKPVGNAKKQFKFASKFPRIPGLNLPEKVLPGFAVPRARKRRQPGQKKLTKKDRKEAGLTPYINLGFDRLFKLKTDVPMHSQVYVNLVSGEPVKIDRVGYAVRAVTDFSHIFTQSPVKDGYSQTIYVPSQQFQSQAATHPLMQEVTTLDETTLLVFGKWSEVQAAVRSDREMELEDAAELFDGIQLGSERARLEDAVMITLARNYKVPRSL